MSVSCVDPSRIPYIQTVDGVPKVDLAGIRQAASDLGTAAAALSAAGYDTFNAWSRISFCYNGPGAQQLWYGLADIGKDCDSMASEGGSIQRAMNTFADTIEPILTKLTNLKSDAEKLQKDVKNFRGYVKEPKYRFETPKRIDNWNDDDSLSDRNDNLTHNIDVQVAAFQEAEREFANTIDKIYNGINYLDPYAVRTNGISYGQKVEYLDAEQNPWGAKTNVQEGCAHYVIASVSAYTGMRVNLDGSVPLDAVSMLAQASIGAMGDGTAWLNSLTPEEAYRLWAPLPADNKQAVAQTYPDAIGNLPGIPYNDRITANMYALHQRMDELEAAHQTGTDEYQGLKNLNDTINLYAGTSNPVSLVGLTIRPGQQPFAITCVGDPDNAQNVTTMVQGMNSSVKNSVSSGVDSAIRLYNDQVKKSGQSCAVFSWFNYDSPDEVGETKIDSAIKGGAQLANDLNGFDATRVVEGTGDAHTSVVAHSYGTIVVGVALTTDGTHVNDVVLQASPGLPTNIASNATQLHADHVYAMTSSQDGLAPTGNLFTTEDRIDPTSPEFGAHVLSAEVDGDLHGVDEHSTTPSDPNSYGYWEDPTNALRNTTLATIGQGENLPYFGTPQQRKALQGDNALTDTFGHLGSSTKSSVIMEIEQTKEIINNLFGR